MAVLSHLGCCVILGSLTLGLSTLWCASEAIPHLSPLVRRGVELLRQDSDTDASGEPNPLLTLTFVVLVF